MNSSVPQQTGTGSNFPSDRPNPWGGGGVAPATPPQAAPPQPQFSPPPAAPAPAPAPEAGPSPEIINLTCPSCGGGLKLRREHIGIDGACVECSKPIRAVASPAGRVSIQLLEEKQPEIPIEVQEVAVELHPEVPSTQPEQPAPVEIPSPWQTNQPAVPEATQENSSPINGNGPVNWSHQAQQNAQQAPMPGQNPDPSSSLNPEMFQTGSIPQPQTAPEPAAGPAFPSPNTPANALPWANASTQPPLVEQGNFGSFEAASPFGPPPGAQQSAANQPIEGSAAQGEISGGGTVSTERKKLGHTGRRHGLGWLKFIAALAILAGIGYAGFVFMPEDKIAQFKNWFSNFIEPAMEAFEEKSETGNIGVAESEINHSVTTPPTTSTPASKAVEPIKSDTGNKNSQSAAEKGAKPPAPEVSSDPGTDVISESLRVNIAGNTALQKYYRALTLEERLQFFVNPEKARIPFENYSSRWEKLPTSAAIEFQKAMLDADSGRWFGIFEVAESGNEKLHRWIAVEDEEGEFRLDWFLYEQLIDNALPRYLDDPTAAPREFRLMIKKGDTVPENNNPWNSEAIGILLQSPFDGQPARPIIIKKADFEALGLAAGLQSGNAKLARLEMAWINSEFDPNSRVPVITRLIGWGAWD